MKLRAQQNWRIDIDIIKGLNEMRTKSDTPVVTLVNETLRAMLERNGILFPLKEDPEKQKKREETPLATIDMSKLKLETNEETIEW
jgi:hypothetical protein